MIDWREMPWPHIFTAFNALQALHADLVGRVEPGSADALGLIRACGAINQELDRANKELARREFFLGGAKC